MTHRQLRGTENTVLPAVVVSSNTIQNLNLKKFQKVITKMIDSFHQKQYDAQTQEIARQAKHLQRDNPDLTWGECIRIAEKWNDESK